MKKLTLFFSWQSDIKENHSIIKDSLVKACQLLKKKKLFDIQYDESTREVSGAPNIERTVAKKIENCDMFIADITPIACQRDKAIPNPNVMLELGLAKSHLSDEATILLVKAGEWKENQLPFDINHQRLSKFNNIEELAMTDFVQKLAEYVAANPRITSVFENNSDTLFNDINVQRNIISGKYLPSVFLDNRDLKQHLRNFVNPMLFSKLIIERCTKINYDSLNRKRRLYNKALFDFNVAPYTYCAAEEDFFVFYKEIEKLCNYVYQKYSELHVGSNHSYLNSSKSGILLEHLNFIVKRICLITSDAGQGKTNLICDLVSNVLLKRRIPFVYLNGYEINSSDIGQSFANALMPNTGKSFAEIMEQIQVYCKYKRKPLILLIDGINENSNPNEFVPNLERFIQSTLQYNCVKILMTCRSEYYKERFAVIENMFGHKMQKIENINKHLDQEEKEKLLNNYLTYFNIKADVNEQITDMFCDNLLLLRIFAEANKNKSIGHIFHIRKDNLFSEYYNMMCQQVATRIRQEERIDVKVHSFYAFFRSIIEYMIEHNQFFNVPFDTVLSSLKPGEQMVFNRFLDENILLRKDLAPTKCAFGHNEVINFTYDAFRDFLISSYLLDEKSLRDFDSFESCVTKFSSAKHQLREGLIPFLFVHAKNTGNTEAIKSISKYNWYESVFDNMIWDIDEEKIEDRDIEMLKEHLPLNSYYLAPKLIFWGRWNTVEHPRLNITLLLDYLATLDDEELCNFMDEVWPNQKTNSPYTKNEDTERMKMVELILERIDNETFCGCADSYFVFELLLYLIPFSNVEALEGYRRWLIKYKHVEQLDKVLKHTHSEKIKSIINSIIRK